MNLRRWVSNGLKAYSVVVNELERSLGKENVTCGLVRVECRVDERVGWRL